MTPLWTALLLGLAGSLHCVGMCGPLALSLPRRSSNQWGALGAVLLYNGGRIATYSLIGAVIGALGSAIWVAGLQSYLGLALGIFFLVLAFGSFQFESVITRWPVTRRLYAVVSKQLGRLMHATGTSTYVLIGALNGLLPCGLVYMAVAGSVTASSWVNSIAYMAFFGLGTLPLMGAVALGGQFVSAQWRTRLRRVTPFMLLLMSALLLYRSLHFILPGTLQFWQDMQNPPMCH